MSKRFKFKPMVLAVLFLMASFTTSALGQTGLQFGTIPPAQSVRTIGNVSLGQTQLGYALLVGSGTPVQITNAGANANASTVPDWTPLGVVAGANSTYTLYWRNASSGQYAVWVLNAQGAVSSGRLASAGEILVAETNLGTDLDGDGQTGLQFTSVGQIGDVEIGSTQLGYAMRVNGSLIQITNAGANASASTVPGWTPIAAVGVGSGFELYWRNAAGQLALWQLGAQGASTGGQLLSLQDAQIAELRIQADIDGDSGIGPKFNGLVRMSQVGQPTLPRWGHSQVWTGTGLIVWGGIASEDNFSGTRTYHGDGGVYNLADDTWAPIARTGAPTERGGHSTVWTGTDMIVWGGWGGPDGVLFNDGYRYRLSDNTWHSVSMVGSPPPVMDSGHSAVWTGSEMIVWGINAFTRQSTGAIYNPASDTWRPMSTNGMPTPRRGQAAVWNGSRMIVWGGKPEGEPWGISQGNGMGAMYDPVSDNWQPISSAGAPWGGETLAPSDGERSSEIMWTGSRLIAVPINSYNYFTESYLQPGGQFDPNANTWTAISTSDLPQGRPYMGVWTGSQVFMVGSSGNELAGFVYDPSAQRWSQIMQDATGSFEGRQGTWAPELKEMLVFGGRWLDGVDEYSGGADNRRGLRLQVESDIRFDSSRQIGGIELGSTQLGYAIRVGSSIIQISNAGANASVSTVPGWTPLGVVAGANSTYTLYWRNASSGQYAVWVLNAAGASTSGRLAGVAEILQVETNLNVDLDGDGQTGLQFGAIPPAPSVRTIGSVSLGQTQLGYALLVGNGTPVQISNAGANASVSTVPGWTPLGVVAGANSTYTLYWRNASSGQYAVWVLNAQGAVSSGRVANVGEILQVETNLNVDLDGDGQTGLQFGAIPPAQGVRTIGNVSLGQTQLGYALLVGNGTPVQISSGGTNVSASSASGWTPLGVVAKFADNDYHSGVVTGYSLYWSNPNTGQYAVWDLNTQGANVSGRGISLGELVAAESSSAADLNADGEIGSVLPGIYIGQFSGNMDNGEIALLVFPDLRAVVLGYNSWQGTGVLVSSFSPNLDGTFSGSLYEGGVFSGAINKLTGSMTGTFSTNLGGSGSFSGFRAADHGRFSTSVTGLYTGNFNSYYGTGTVYVILMADGRFFTYFIDPVYGLTSGGSASVGYGNSFYINMVDGTTASGFFDEVNKRITGSFWSPYTSGTFQVTRFNH